MKKTILLILIIINLISSAQEMVDTTYNVEIFLSSCPNFSFFNKPKYPADKETMTFGYSFFVRAMWHPSRMLSLGIMSGYSLLANEDIPTAKGNAVLSAIPMQIAITMQRLETEVGLGIGPYLMRSELDDGVNKTTGNRIEFGITFWGSYYFSISDDVLIAPEVKILYLGYRGITTILPSVTLKYYMYRY